MYRNILVPITPDHSRDELGAIATARQMLSPDGHITALSVVENIPSYAVTYLPEDLTDRARTKVEEELEKALREDRDIVREVRLGRPSQMILDYARQNDVDCIVIPSHRPGIQDFLIGSTAARVVRHALCSVHVLR